MASLVKVFNSNDLRYLLDVSILPKNYDTNYLIPVLDVILFEYEELKNDKFYSNFIRKSDFGIREGARLIVLRGCYTLHEVGYISQSKELLKSVKSNAHNLKSIEFEMNKLTQNMQVRAIKQAGKEKEKTSFGALCARIKSQLPNADPQNASVAEFVEYENIIKSQNG